MSSAARMPRWSSTPEYASVPVRSMVCSGLMRPSDGYLLFAPCGPCWSKLSASEMTLPFLTRRAAATMSSAVVKLSVPISSFGPHLPQFLYFSAASRRSWRVIFLGVMEIPFLRGLEEFASGELAVLWAKAAGLAVYCATRNSDDSSNERIKGGCH